MQQIFSQRSVDLDLAGFSFEINRKKIKHIYFRVYPKQKKIVVSAPYQIDAQTLHKAILSKKEWLQKKIKEPVRKIKSPRIQYLNSDTVWFKGKPRTLRVFFLNGRPKVYPVNDNHVHVFVKQKNHASSIRKLIINWLREELRQEIRGLIKKWEPVLNVKINDCRIRKMRTRWGSCNINVKRIWLNAVLIHLPPVFLEYVVVHEMVHLLERLHNARFNQYMDQYIPQWRTLKKEMDRFSL
ncbi:MAG: M48 family metallopeptidase [Desulfobacula sp.]|nr:M48 family metallopeptidase [Desulfobacula sp.]